jgi:type II secretory pathway component PulK
MRRRGFATLIALGLIGLIGAALAALAVSFSHDVKRNARQMEDAQLRQLLIAGEAAARGSISGQVQPEKVELPAELGSAGMSVTWERTAEASADGVQVRATARTTENRSAAQMLRFVKEANGWVLQSAELD